MITTSGTRNEVDSDGGDLNNGVLIVAEPESLRKPMDCPYRLLMGAGPSNVSLRVLAAANLPMQSQIHPEFLQVMNDVKEGIRYAFQTKNEWTFAVSGSGHSAMETAVCNLLEPDDVALVCLNGFWSERVADIVDRNGSVAKFTTRPMGEVFTLEEIERAIQEYKPAVVFIVYGESSSGVLQPLDGLGDLCHKYNALLVVDTVCAVGGVPIFMDAWGVDVIFGGGQKALSVPPAPSPISFSMRARNKIANRKVRVRSHYFDAEGLSNHWSCDEGPIRPHHTEMIVNMYMLREGLANLVEVGLEKSWKNHRACAELLYEGLEKIGLELHVKDKAIRNPCVTVVKVPEGISAKDVSDYALKKHHVEISGGLGGLADKVWRIGIMGFNCTPENVETVVKVLDDAIKNMCR